MSLRRVWGWGRYPIGESEVRPLPTLETFPGGKGIARGLGRSYGDASFFERGLHVGSEIA